MSLISSFFENKPPRQISLELDHSTIDCWKITLLTKTTFPLKEFLNNYFLTFETLSNSSLSDISLAKKIALLPNLQRDEFLNHLLQKIINRDADYRPSTLSQIFLYQANPFKNLDIVLSFPERFDIEDLIFKSAVSLNIKSALKLLNLKKGLSVNARCYLFLFLYSKQYWYFSNFEEIGLQNLHEISEFMQSIEKELERNPPSSYLYYLKKKYQQIKDPSLYAKYYQFSSPIYSPFERERTGGIHLNLSKNPEKETLIALENFKGNKTNLIPYLPWKEYQNPKKILKALFLQTPDSDLVFKNFPKSFPIFVFLKIYGNKLSYHQIKGISDRYQLTYFEIKPYCKLWKLLPYLPQLEKEPKEQEEILSHLIEVLSKEPTKASFLIFELMLCFEKISTLPKTKTPLEQRYFLNQIALYTPYHFFFILKKLKIKAAFESSLWPFYTKKWLEVLPSKTCEPHLNYLIQEFPEEALTSLEQHFSFLPSLLKLQKKDLSFPLFCTELQKLSQELSPNDFLLAFSILFSLRSSFDKKKYLAILKMDEQRFLNLNSKDKNFLEIIQTEINYPSEDAIIYLIQKNYRNDINDLLLKWIKKKPLKFQVKLSQKLENSALQKLFFETSILKKLSDDELEEIIKTTSSPLKPFLMLATGWLDAEYPNFSTSLGITAEHLFSIGKKRVKICEGNLRPLLLFLNSFSQQELISILPTLLKKVKFPNTKQGLAALSKLFSRAGFPTNYEYSLLLPFFDETESLFLEEKNFIAKNFPKNLAHLPKSSKRLGLLAEFFLKQNKSAFFWSKFLQASIGCSFPQKTKVIQKALQSKNYLMESNPSLHDAAPDTSFFREIFSFKTLPKENGIPLWGKKTLPYKRPSLPAIEIYWRSLFELCKPKKILFYKNFPFDLLFKSDLFQEIIEMLSNDGLLLYYYNSCSSLHFHDLFHLPNASKYLQPFFKSFYPENLLLIFLEHDLFKYWERLPPEWVESYTAYILPYKKIDPLQAVKKIRSEILSRTLGEQEYGKIDPFLLIFRAQLPEEFKVGLYLQAAEKIPPTASFLFQCENPDLFTDFSSLTTFLKENTGEFLNKYFSLKKDHWIRTLFPVPFIIHYLIIEDLVDPDFVYPEKIKQGLYKCFNCFPKYRYLGFLIPENKEKKLKNYILKFLLEESLPLKDKELAYIDLLKIEPDFTLPNETSFQHQKFLAARALTSETYLKEFLLLFGLKKQHLETLEAIEPVLNILLALSEKRHLWCNCQLPDLIQKWCLWSLETPKVFKKIEEFVRREYHVNMIPQILNDVLSFDFEAPTV